MYKRIILIFMVIVIIFSISVPFASAADGETKSVQYYNYNGIVIPDISEIWDKDAYPYVLIYREGAVVYVNFLDLPLYVSSSGGALCSNADAESKCLIVKLNVYTENQFILGGEVQWHISDPVAVIDKFFIRPSEHTAWCNVDLYYPGGIVLGYETTEPVIDKLVEYSTDITPSAPLYDYGGLVVPSIETLEDYDLSLYPYVVLRNNGASAVLTVSTVPFVVKNSSSNKYVYTSAAGSYATASRNIVEMFNGKAWGKASSYTKDAPTMIGNAAQLVWSNCDIYHEDGTLFYTSVAPVPVDSPDVGGGGSGGGGDVEIADITFFNNILSLFTSTFDAVTGDEYFRFLIYFVSVEVAFGLFFFITKGSKKL